MRGHLASVVSWPIRKWRQASAVARSSGGITSGKGPLGDADDMKSSTIPMMSRRMLAARFTALR